jgi:hypothetical protein
VQVSCKMSMLFWLPLVACNVTVYLVNGSCEMHQI